MLPELARLSLEDQVFITAFLRSHGSIKEMEQVFGVSYPTIKARLNRIAGQLEFVDTNPSPSRAEVLERLKSGEIDAAEAIRALEALQMTPNIAIVHVENPHWRGIRLWVPLFLLWIPLVLLSPLIFLVVLGVCLAGRINPWRAIAAFWAISCSLAGNRCPRLRGRQPGYGSHLVRLTMNNERRAILSLIAMGRITPREAERLLACWPDSSETAWVVGTCAVIVAGMAFGHPGELATFANYWRGLQTSPKQYCRWLARLASSIVIFHTHRRRNSMNENRRQILEMLAAGRITADEAERLLTALEPEIRATADEFAGPGKTNGTNGFGPRPRRILPSICACWWKPTRR